MARRWAPFADPVFHVAWAGERAMVWGWSSSVVLAPVADGERPPRRVLPESLFRGDTAEAGAELVRMDEGFEGRAWSAGALVASTWWPAMPSLADWNLFARGAGLGAVAAVPGPLDGDLREAPWSAGPAAGADFGRHRALAVPAAIAVMLVAIGFPLGSALRLYVETRGLERAITKQEALVAEILSAREGAEADAAEIEALLALRAPVGQIRALAALIRSMPGSGWEVLEWRIPERERVEAVLRIANPDPPSLVRGLEGSGVFRAVGVEMGARPDEVVVKANLAGTGAGAGPKP